MLLVAISVICCNEGGHFMDLHGGHHWILGGHFRLFTNFHNFQKKNKVIKKAASELPETALYIGLKTYN